MSATPGAAARGGLAAFGLMWFWYYGAIGLFNTYAPLLWQQLGHSTLVIGALASLQAWTRVIAPYGWGWLADHRGHRVALLRGATLFCVVAAAALWALQSSSLWAVALAIALLYLANGAVTPISEALILARLQRSGGMDIGRYGRVRVWGSVGFIASVVLFGFLLQAVGIAWLPLLVLGMYGVLALATRGLPVGEEAALPQAASAVPVAHGIRVVMRKPVVLWFFAGTMLTVLAHTSLYAFFSLYLHDLGYDKGGVGLIWAVAVAAEIGFFSFMGDRFKRWPAHHWLVLAGLLAALRFVLTAAFAQVVVLLVLAQLLHALTFAAQHMACTSVIARHFPDRLRGRASALYSTLGYGLTGVVGGLAGGALSERFGLQTVFWAAAVVALAGALCSWMSARAETAESLAQNH